MNGFNVINLHITQRCNYSCKHCFARFDASDSLPENGELELEEWRCVGDAIEHYFRQCGIVDGRINVAGGEPMLVPFLNELITYIVGKKIAVSVITNATLLSKQVIDNWQDKVDMIGISIDSLDNQTNVIIGRSCRNGQTLDYKNLVEVLQYAKEKRFKLKVNTVVSQSNKHKNINQM